jgi:hypothetical protein
MRNLGQTAIAIGLAATAALAAAAAGPLPTGIAALNTATDGVRARPVDWDGRPVRWPLPPISAEIAAQLAEGGYYPYARYPTYYPWHYYSRPAYSSYGDPRPYDGGYYGGYHGGYYGSYYRY